jgi:hypothetical protein
LTLIVKRGFRGAGTGRGLADIAEASVGSGWRSGTRTDWVEAIGFSFREKEK